MGLVLTWPVGNADPEAPPANPPAGPVTAYVVASALGGGITGFLIGLLAGAVRQGPAVVDDVATGAVLSVALIAVVSEWRGRVTPLPERHAQVPRPWLQWNSRTRTALAFGLMIGSGALTFLKHATAYALGALAFLAPSLLAATLIGALYGFSRGATLVATWAGDRFLGRRPPLPLSDRTMPVVNYGLAAVAVMSLMIALPMAQ